MSKLVIVAGSGRSGTSTLAGVLSQLGLRVPQPEIPANNTNPKGFFEPVWVVAFHKRLLKRAAVPQYDARPEGFALTAEIGERPRVQRQVREWLSNELKLAPEIVIKDPRDTWFLPMWLKAANELGAETGVAMTIRHPAEVVGSHATHYLRRNASQRRQFAGANRIANWINLTLATELATRSGPRCFVRYTDLIGDWRAVAERIGTSLDLSFRDGITEQAAAAVDEFVDPSLHRIQTTWENVDAPERLIDLAEAVWQAMSSHIERGAEESESVLDTLRDEYAQLYAESASIVTSTIRAAAANAASAAAEHAEREVREPPRPPRPAPSGRVARTGARRAAQGARSIVRKRRGRILGRRHGG